MLAGFTWEVIFGIPQIIFVAGGLIGIAAVICTAWFKIEQLRSDKDLKLSMLQRGMSAQEIDQVVSAGGQDDKD